MRVVEVFKVKPSIRLYFESNDEYCRQFFLDLIGIPLTISEVAESYVEIEQLAFLERLERPLSDFGSVK